MSRRKIKKVTKTPTDPEAMWHEIRRLRAMVEAMKARIELLESGRRIEAIGRDTD